MNGDEEHEKAKGLTGGPAQVKQEAYQYKLVTGDAKEPFEQAITELLNEGWKPLGDVKVFFSPGGQMMLAKEMLFLPVSALTGAIAIPVGAVPRR
jgi:hypothetical protein